MDIKKYLPFFISNALRRLKSRLQLYPKFKKMHGYELDLKNPRTFNEKIYYRKYHSDAQYLSKFADKAAVRDYVEATVGKQYLIPLIGVYDQLTHEVWDSLPNRFVLKTSHGSGGNHIHIVKDKSKSDPSQAIAKLSAALKEDWGAVTIQPFYSVMPRKIVVEELLEDGNISDYKFHCFRDKIFVQYDMDRYIEHKRCFFDENWQKLNLKMGFPDVQEQIERPGKFEEMVELARRLSEEFSYVRVDLYYVQDRVYFGEITLTHENGTKRFQPIEKDREWGDYWGEPI